MPFFPGLVGGHCIGVDPYYLTYKSKELGYQPRVLLSGREINDEMGKWIVNQLIMELVKKKVNLNEANILILGVTFKENCSDLRNSKVFQITEQLDNYNINYDLYDPIAEEQSIYTIYKNSLLKELPKDKQYISVICAVAHKEFTEYKISDWSRLLQENGIFFDIKGILPRELNAIRL